MTKQQERIVSMRKSGMSYQDIANTLDISIGNARAIFSRTKSRNGEDITDADTCRFCGAPLNYTAGARKKLYCSNKCHDAWNNRLKASRAYNRVCEYCGKKFTSIGNPDKRFCGRTCRTLATRKGEQNGE